MFDILVHWYKRRFSDPNAVALACLLVVLFLLIYFFRSILTPIIIAVILAYLLDWPTTRLERAGLSRTFASTLVFVLFLLCVILVILLLLPIMWHQAVSLIEQLTLLATRLNEFILRLSARYPDFIDDTILNSFSNKIQHIMMQAGNQIIRFSLNSLASFLTVIVYSFILPLLLFFMLKDKQQIRDYCQQFLPQKRALIHQVAVKMHLQMGDFLRGKAIEVVLLAVIASIVFFFLKLNYALLLGILVGLSLLIPYIGLIIVTIPVTLVAFSQWGMGGEFWLVIICYSIIQIIDGNVIAPLLYSEVVNLHPLAIIVAVIIFGGLWGVWGVFFAIPLAMLINIILQLWPDNNNPTTANT